MAVMLTVEGETPAEATRVIACDRCGQTVRVSSSVPDTDVVRAMEIHDLYCTYGSEYRETAL